MHQDRRIDKFADGGIVGATYDWGIGAESGGQASVRHSGAVASLPGGDRSNRASGAGLAGGGRAVPVRFICLEMANADSVMSISGLADDYPVAAWSMAK
jgi:hypothetical protein